MYVCYYNNNVCVCSFYLKFDYSLFDKFTDPGKDQSSNGKFPLMKPNYESVLVPNMYFSKPSFIHFITLLNFTDKIR